MAVLLWSSFSAAPHPPPPPPVRPQHTHTLPRPSLSCQVTMLIYLCTVLSCGVCVRALVARPWSRFASADPVPGIRPWNLYRNNPSVTHICCFYLKIHSVVLTYSFQNAAWHMSCFYCMRVCECTVRVRVRICMCMEVGLIAYM